MEKIGGSMSLAWVVGVGAVVAMASMGCAQTAAKPPSTSLIVAASIGDESTAAPTPAPADTAEAASETTAAPSESSTPAEEATVAQPTITEPAVSQPVRRSQPSFQVQKVAQTAQQEWWRPVWRK